MILRMSEDALHSQLRILLLPVLARVVWPGDAHVSDHDELDLGIRIYALCGRERIHARPACRVVSDAVVHLGLAVCWQVRHDSLMEEPGVHPAGIRTSTTRVTEVGLAVRVCVCQRCIGQAARREPVLDSGAPGVVRRPEDHLHLGLITSSGQLREQIFVFILNRYNTAHLNQFRLRLTS